MYILFHILLHCGLSQDILHCTIGPCCLSILSILVYICNSQTPKPSLPSAPPTLATTSLFSMSASFSHAPSLQFWPSTLSYWPQPPPWTFLPWLPNSLLSFPVLFLFPSSFPSFSASSLWTPSPCTCCWRLHWLDISLVCHPVPSVHPLFRLASSQKFQQWFYHLLLTGASSSYLLVSVYEKLEVESFGTLPIPQFPSTNTDWCWFGPVSSVCALSLFPITFVQHLMSITQTTATASQMGPCSIFLYLSSLLLLDSTLFLKRISDLAQKTLWTPQSIQSNSQFPQSGTCEPLYNLTPANVSVLPLWGSLTSSPHPCRLCPVGEINTDQWPQKHTSVN